MKPITPVLLAGGSGTRLWPLSRKSYPKQFSKLIDEYSLKGDKGILVNITGGKDIHLFEVDQ